MHVHYAIVFVGDMRRSVAFYRDTIGLPLRFEWPHWTEFATDGATLVLHLAESPPPTSADGEPRAGSCRPGLHVANLAEFHQRMIERKVHCLQEPKDVFGSRVAQYADPDGLTISVGEPRA